MVGKCIMNHMTTMNMSFKGKTVTRYYILPLFAHQSHRMFSLRT